MSRFSTELHQLTNAILQLASTFNKRSSINSNNSVIVTDSNHNTITIYNNRDTINLDEFEAEWLRLYRLLSIRQQTMFFNELYEIEDQIKADISHANEAKS